MGGRGKKETHHPTLSQPPKNLTASVAALKAEVNATKTALATEVALKLGGGATVDATLPRFTGDVTCYMDDATGDVVGLQLGSAPALCGSAPALCSTAGTPRTFAVPADGYIADVKVVVDKATGLVGELAFIVKSNASLVPTNVVTCGTHGGVGVSVMPKLSALAGLTASCKPAQSGPQAALGLAIDPAALSVSVTTVNAPAGATPAPTPGPLYAYVTNGVSPGSVSVCPVDPSTGALVSASCATSGSGFNNPRGIAVSCGYAYVTNAGGGGIVSVCRVDPSTGALASCTTFSDPSFNNFLAGIAVSGGYAYVVNRPGISSGSVSVCRVDPSTGALVSASCATSGSGFDRLVGIAVT
jgi:hypothetical protein